MARSCPCAQPRKISEYFRNRSAPLARGACASDGAPPPRGPPPGGAQAGAAGARSPPPSAPAEERVERRCAECAKPPPKAGLRVVEVGTDAVCDLLRQLGEQAGSARDDQARSTRAGCGGCSWSAADQARPRICGSCSRGEVEIRIVDGEGHPQCERRPTPISCRADVVAVSELDDPPRHSVSKLYTDQRASFRDKL